MPLVIRQADPERDYPAVAALRTLRESHATTADDLRAIDSDIRDGTHVLRLVADLDGQIIAAGDSVHNIWHGPGLFKVQLFVDSAATLDSCGQELIARLEAFATANGADALEARAGENDADLLAFLLNQDYETIAQSFESVLDLANFDPSRFEDLSSMNLKFFTFADTAMDVEAARNLWDLNTETGRDEPLHGDYAPTLEQFQESVIDSSWFDPRGQFIAADGDYWIGMSAVCRMHSDGHYNLFTGVRRDYRGRGIAKALKVRSTLYAKESGGTELKTNNDSRNKPMIAINRSLGYKPLPGWIITRRALS